MSVRATTWIAFFAIGLWVVTIAVATTYYVQGVTTPTTDGRTAIVMGPGEADLVLAEMRGMLDTVNRVLKVLTGPSGGMGPQVAQAARRSGMSAMVMPPVFMAQLPLRFKEMGIHMHRGFDELAMAAEAGASREALLERLVSQTDTCVACHAAYRLHMDCTDCVP